MKIIELYEYNTKFINGKAISIVKMPKVVHCKKDNYDVYIGRPSKWGNPFIIGKDGDRKEVINKYKIWILKQRSLLDSLPELKDKILGCWCAPKKCHGDVLVELYEKIVGKDKFSFF